MADFNWCHGPECHEKKTLDRVRGTKGSKVLRTRKISITNYMQTNPDASWNWFCSQGCERDFWHKYANQIRAIAPRTEALETPIDDPKKTTTTTSYGYTYSSVEINKIEG